MAMFNRLGVGTAVSLAKAQEFVEAAIEL
jgi:hypothetical protein